jgi:uncharacterized protein
MSTLWILIGAGFFTGFVDSIAGGGGLISVPTLMMLGLPPSMVLGTNKVIGISNSFASSFRYRYARLISWRNLFPLVLSAFFLSIVGAYVATHINSQVLRPVILALLIFAGILVLLRDRFGMENRTPRARDLTWMFVPLIGLYDGFFGPGTGTFLMMTFVFFHGDELLTAGAKSRAVNFATNLGALIWFASHGSVNYRFVWPAALASFVGGTIGSSLAVKKGAYLVRPVFIAVTWGLIARLAWQML